MNTISIIPIPGIPAISPGDNLPAILLSAIDKAQIGLQNGDVVIVRSGPGYRLVPVLAAEKIREREPSVLVTAAPVAGESPATPDDPYREFVVPDDLKW